MYCQGHLSAKEGDETKIQFDEIIDAIARKLMENFLALNWEKEHLDTFFGEWLHTNETSKLI